VSLKTTQIACLESPDI